MFSCTGFDVRRLKSSAPDLIGAGNETLNRETGPGDVKQRILKVEFRFEDFQKSGKPAVGHHLNALLLIKQKMFYRV